MFVINPDPYSLPSYRIGPFQTRDLSRNHILPDRDLIGDYFSERFMDKYFHFTINGRKAINVALKSLTLGNDDVVTILTTTGNLYISGCVTHEIEKFCKWSRNIEEKTKVILVNHEFGYPYPNIQELKKYNLPIIEDCAGSFYSQSKKNHIGKIGDYVIYSFPKMFPLQIGGLLVTDQLKVLDMDDQPSQEENRHMMNVLSSQIGKSDKIISKRLENYDYLKKRFAELDFSERFKMEDGIVPSVFMFKTSKQSIDLPELKKYYYQHGVQCSVFYGEEAFFIPVHQSLTTQDLDYFVEILKSFVSNDKFS